ncbi:hypothetical protein D3C76_1592570 [compost metagenome]
MAHAIGQLLNPGQLIIFVGALEIEVVLNLTSIQPSSVSEVSDDAVARLPILVGDPGYTSVSHDPPIFGVKRLASKDQFHSIVPV